MILRKALSVGALLVCAGSGIVGCGTDDAKEPESAATSAKTTVKLAPPAERQVLDALKVVFEGMEGEKECGSDEDLTVTSSEDKPAPTEWFTNGDPNNPEKPSKSTLRPAILITTSFCGKDTSGKSGSYEVDVAGFETAELAEQWFAEFTAVVGKGDSYKESDLDDCETTAKKAEGSAVGGAAIDVELQMPCESDQLPAAVQAALDFEPETFTFALAGRWLIATEVMRTSGQKQVETGEGSIMELYTARDVVVDEHKRIVTTLTGELAEA